MLPQYKLKSTEIFTAVQFKDDPMSMMWIVEMVPEDKLIVNGEILKIKDDNNWTSVYVGDYILKDNYGLSVLCAAKFEKEYELL